MAYGIKISKPGFSVSSAGIKDLALSTEYPILKEVDSGEGTITLSGAGETLKTEVLTHNLGYKAETWVFIDAPYMGIPERERVRIPFRVSTGNHSFWLTFTNTTTVINVFDNDLSWGDDREYAYHYRIFYDQSY